MRDMGEKEIWKIGVVLALLAVGILSNGCKQNGTSPIPAVEFFDDNPVAIIWQDSHADTSIKDFQTQVSVYSMNNRVDAGTTLRTSYRMSLKTVTGKQFARLDFAPEYADGHSLAVVSDRRQMVVFNPDNGQVLQRLVTAGDVSSDLTFLSTETALTRMDLSLIRQEARRLALDMSENGGGHLTLDIPSHFFPPVDGEIRQSTRIAFDTDKETLSQVEVVTLREDGTKVTTITYPMYQDEGGVPVKVGSVTVVESKAAGLLEGFEDVGYFESMEQLPEMSLDEYERLKDEGLVVDEALVFGNPADLSYTETIIEVYNDIKINNSLDESLFRLLLE